MHLEKRPRIASKYNEATKNTELDPTRLFITNKFEFDSELARIDKVMIQKKVHQMAYNMLKIGVNVHNSVPFMIVFDLDEVNFSFQFEGKKGNFYYYKFIYLIS